MEKGSVRAGGTLKPARWLGGPLAVQYLSEEWAELALERVETDETVQKAVKGMDLSVLAIILSPPKDCYGFIFVDFKDGALAEYRVGHDYHAVTDDIEPTFVVSGHYDVFAQINQGHITERKALLSGKLHLTGGLFKALKHMRAMESVTHSLLSIECMV